MNPCQHPDSVIVFLAGGWQWCSRCGAVYRPAPGAKWELPTGDNDLGRIMCPECGKYVGGHATGAGDICDCDFAHVVIKKGKLY